jgi:hypothetical protein
MEATVRIFPATKALKSKVRFPLGLAISPTQDGTTVPLDCTPDDLFVCRNCRSYLSPNCPIDGNTWKCAFCGAKNSGSNTDSFTRQASRESYDVILGRKREIALIHVIYLSSDLKGIDFVKAKVFTLGLLRNLPESARCLIFIGSDESECSILLPPKSDSSSAAIARFSSIRGLVGLDLASFFFTSQNEFIAERAIENLPMETDSDPHRKAADLALALSQFLSNAPIRVISIIREVTRKSIDLESLRQYLVRLDFVVADSTPKARNLAAEIPGTLIFLSNHNPALQAKHLIAQSTKFQLTFHPLSKGCQIQIVEIPRPFTDTNDSELFVPVVPNNEFPVMLEVNPDNNADVLIFQFISRFIVMGLTERFFVLRVSNVSLKTTANLADYIDSVNWNCALWFWVRKILTLNRAEALPAIFRATSLLLAELGNKFDESILRAICALPSSQLIGPDEAKSIRAADLVFLSPPRRLKMGPVIDEANSANAICQSLFGISEERRVNEQGPSKIARKLQLDLAVYVPIAESIPVELLSVSPTSLAAIQSMHQ